MWRYTTPSVVPGRRGGGAHRHNGGDEDTTRNLQGSLCSAGRARTDGMDRHRYAHAPSRALGPRIPRENNTCSNQHSGIRDIGPTSSSCSMRISIPSSTPPTSMVLPRCGLHPELRGGRLDVAPGDLSLAASHR